jgi:dihydrofolate synthase/folylpolyglutamate synthase
MSSTVDDAELSRVEKELVARWPESKIEWKLERMAALMELLGDPQLSYQVIHIAGTNGKTSTARMAEELLRTLGLRTGRNTSPHLESITERIVLDGEPLSPAAFVAAYEELAPYLDLVDSRSDVRLSFFEAITGLAFAVFADAPVDVAVVEVGMGGRLDATNIVNAPVAVITPIDLDHVAHLGSTIAAIAVEKAGIIKPGQLVVIADQHPEAMEVVIRKAVDVDATIAREGVEFGVLARRPAVGGQLVTIRGLNGVYDELFVPLYGRYQASNAACALAAVEGLVGSRGSLDVALVRQAFDGVRSPGRLEILRSSPTVLVDATHNPAGARATTEALADSFAFRRLIGVVATLSDKDSRGLLEIFEPVLAQVVVTQNSSPRSTPVDELAAVAVDVFGADRVEVVARLDEAIEIAVERAGEADEAGEADAVATTAGGGVLITGSVITAGDARRLLRRA